MILFPISRKHLFLLALTFIILAAACFLICSFISPRVEFPEVLNKVLTPLREPSAPFLFIIAMIVLPPFGFPLSFFLALAGIRFGIIGGTILTFLVLPLHMTICYTLAHTFLRAPIVNFLTRKGYKIPMLQTSRPGLGMFGFLLMPGPPYVLKTYLLAMTELPYHRFLLFNWGTESLITLPIVAVTGAAASKNWILLGIALFIFAVSLGLRWQQKRKEEV